MRILTRYLLREVAAAGLIGAAVFTFVLFTRDLGRILELVVRIQSPLPSVAEIFFFTVPVALTYTIPMGVLIGILIGLSRLAADSEITAMRASGLGVWTFLRILSIFVFIWMGDALFNSVYLAPKSQAALGRLQDRLKSSQASFRSSTSCVLRGFSTARAVRAGREEARKVPQSGRECSLPIAVHPHPTVTMAKGHSGQ